MHFFYKDLKAAGIEPINGKVNAWTCTRFGILFAPISILAAYPSSKQQSSCGTRTIGRPPKHITGPIYRTLLLPLKKYCFRYYEKRDRKRDKTYRLS